MDLRYKLTDRDFQRWTDYTNEILEDNALLRDALSSARRQMAELEQRVAAATAQVEELRNHQLSGERKLANLRIEMENSTSWKVTAPLRWIKTFISPTRPVS